MQRFKDFVEHFPSVRIATQDDNENLISFLRDRDMESDTLSLRYDRTPNFFAWPCMQGPQSWTLIFENSDSTMGAVGTLVHRPAWINGREHWVTYLSDLRFSRKVARPVYTHFWKFFSALISESESIECLHRSPYFYTYVFADNTQALRFLTRKREGVVYAEIERFKSLFVCGRKPWRVRASKASVAPFDDFEQLRARRERELQFGFRDEKFFPEMETAIKYTDSEGSTFCLPLKQGHERSMVVDRAPWSLRALWLSGRIWGHPTTRLGQAFKNLYLSRLTHEHSSASLEKALSEILHYLYNQKALREHPLALADVPFSFDTSVLERDFWVGTMPTIVFQIIHENSNPKIDILSGRSLSLDIAFT